MFDLPNWRSFPTSKCRPAEVFSYDSSWLYNIEEATRDVVSNPDGFNFGLVLVDQVYSEAESALQIDTTYVDGMSEQDAMRPVMMATAPDGTKHLIDGFHRVVRAKSDRRYLVVGWLLTPDQSSSYRSPKNTNANNRK